MLFWGLRVVQGLGGKGFRVSWGQAVEVRFVLPFDNRVLEPNSIGP